MTTVAVAAVGALTAPASAQSTTTAAPARAVPKSSAQSAADDSNSQADIVVTAERRSTTVQNTPISLSVLGGAQLDQSTSAGLTQTLNSVPGVAATVNYQTGGTQLTVRGVSAAGATFNGAGTVAYYLDSTPFGFVRTAIGPDLNPYDLSRVEILRGPQGTLYGAGGLNGVVRVLTNDPDLSKFDVKGRFDVSSTYHAQGANYGGDGEINIPLIRDVLAVRGVIGLHHYAGWIDSVNDKGVNTAKIENYRAKIAFKPADNFTAQFAFWRTVNTYGAPTAGDDNYFNKALLPQPIKNSYDSYSLRLAYDADAFTITNEASYLTYRGFARTDLNPVGLARFQGQTDLSSRVYTEQLDLASKDTGPFKWSAGFFYRDARDVTYQPFNTPTASLLFDNFADASKSWAVYGELGYKFADDRLELTGGLRYFHDASLSQALSPSQLGPVSLDPFKANFNAVTPRVVLQWRPNSNHSLYASYSQGFRSGVVQDEEVTIVAPNFAAAEPDRLHNFEIGAKGRFGGIFEYTAAVFYIKWDRVQQVVQVPILPGSTVLAGALINGSSASGAGVEGSLYLNLSDRLRIGGAASYNGLTLDDALYSAGVLLFDKGQRLNYSPKITASGSADYTIPLFGNGGSAVFNTSLNYVSQQQTVTLRGSARVVKNGNNMFFLNSRVTFNTPDKRWSLGIFGTNLTNNNGATIRAGSVTYFDSRVQPRTFGAQVAFHY
jgi:outer membrane receptor protein involved in Fe transport